MMQNIKHRMRLVDKKFQVYFIDSLSFSLECAIFAAVISSIIFMITKLDTPFGGLSLYYCIGLFAYSIFSTFICSIFFIRIAMVVWIEGTIFQYEILIALIISIIVIVRIGYITNYEIKHNGYSKGGEKAGIKLVNVNGSPCGIKQLLLRNTILFTGGMFLCFLPCLIPAI